MGKSSAVLAMLLLAAPAAFAEGTALDFDGGPSVSALVGQARASASGLDEGYRCHDFAFKADSPDASEPVRLWTIRYARNCRLVGDPAHGGNIECREEVVGIDELEARVVLKVRKPLRASETEVFQVCLENGKPAWEPVSTVYQYSRLDEGGPGDVVLAAGERAAKP